MKRIMSVVCCILFLLPVFLKPAVALAYPGDAFKDQKGRAREGIVMFVDYFNGKKQEYLKTVPVRYDDNGRMLDDGFTYHLYDKNGHELMISNPMYDYPFFGDFHLFNSEEAKIQYNADGTPSTYSRLYRKPRFNYDSKGNVQTIEFISGEMVEYRITYSYSGNRIGKIVVDDFSGGSGGKTEYTFEYDKDLIAKIHGHKQDSGGSYSGTTETVYSYDFENKLKSITYSRQDTVYEAISYSYDSRGRVVSAENYIYDKAEEGYVIYYQYDEEPEETEAATETEAPPSEGEIKIKEVFPETGSSYVSEPTGYVHIYFNKAIEKIHPDLGNMRLVNDNTGEVFQWNWAGLSKTMKEGVYRIYGERLCIKLPSKLSEGFDGFQTGCTYHLEMDPEFVSFKETKEKYRGGKIWEVHVVWDVNRVRTGTFSFTSTEEFDISKNRVGTAQFTYDPAYFMKSSRSFDPHLAVLSLDMAMASFNGFGRYPGSTFIKNFFRALGFPENSIWANADYDSKSKPDTTGVAIASGKLDEETTLIAIAVRSGNYGKEWGGNFRVGFSSTGISHLGFQIGSDHVMEALEQYLSEKKINGHVKIWISGYSRGSAITNLTAARLGDGAVLKGINYDREDIYAYCFEVPATTTDSNAGSGKYDYIYNIVNPVDAVPRLPLYQWGFIRYGKMVYIPAPGTETNIYSSYLGSMKSEFKEIYGAELKYVPDAFQLRGLNRLMEDVSEVVEDRDVYAEKLQVGVIEAVLQYAAGSDFKIDEVGALVNLSVLAAKNGAREVLKDPEIFLEKLENIIKQWVNKTLQPVSDAKFYFSDEDALSKLLVAHFPEFNLAWLKALEDTGLLEESVENASRSPSSRYARNLVKFNCPVTVVVSDREGTAVASISSDGSIWLREDSPVDAWAEEDGGKVFSVPCENEFSFSAVAEEPGQMQISVVSEDLLSGEAVRVTNYYELPLEIRRKYELQMDTGYVGSDYSLILTDPEQRLLEPDLSASEGGLPLHHIEAECNGNGFVSGSGDYAEGLYAVLKAIPDDGSVFTGWVDRSGNVISADLMLVIHVFEDQSLEARFEKKGEGIDPEESGRENGSGAETKPSDGKDRKTEASPIIPIMILLILPGLAALVVGIILAGKNKKKKQ